jgi:hypothetical protein
VRIELACYRNISDLKEFSSGRKIHFLKVPASDEKEKQLHLMAQNNV